MPVVSQSIIRPIVPVGASTMACAVAHAVAPRRSSTASSHASWAAPSSSARHELLVDLRGLGAVHAQHVEHVLLVLGVAGERAHAAGGAGAGGVGVTGHQRGDRGRPGPPSSES